MSKMYKKAGVSLQRGYEVIERIRPLIKTTSNAGTMSSIGGFGGLFDLGKYNYKNPVLVSSTDGVGTKVLLVADANRGHTNIGRDLVAMCVNDVVALGAKPLFFLDYFATGKLAPEITERVVKGICAELQKIDTVLIGGETAEMPDMYDQNHYDLAGFVVGVVEKNQIIDGQKNIQVGDVLIALPSSGPHANGFSLLRKVLFKDNNFSYVERVPYKNATIIAELLTPTKIYVNQILELQKHVKIHGIAHITGGGFMENIPRMIPDGLTYDIDFKDVRVSEFFQWIGSLLKAPLEEMYSTFNMGVGMVLAISPRETEKALKVLQEQCGEDAYILGKIVKK